eukprot:CAMPEP_0197839024 /NCGR_PEP_ID=MMETSP1437-20131217/40539_1 /TAXON_ID=49252 ORGANISM="Eucampia antarctica, Strain CCMP1452" /NCGR_SAMPLE_ID=MMETSP1437 /ASSEMBLY_ACC=CAM_ASM_001096 /LENGTH=186 /DNA_ID=CAMNT_0043447645 /DNA_START=168 /DNA_END=728 /DNA_ORIENTATION=-
MSVDTQPSEKYDEIDRSEEVVPMEEGISKKDICVSASIDLPFGADVAFNAFVDLPRQPSWSSWLRSVKYIDDDDSDFEYSSCGIPLRQTKWTISFQGLKFSWKARSTIIERPTKIGWESISGLKNQGCVTFMENEHGTRMTLAMTFVAPKIVATLLRRSSRITSTIEKVLMSTLVQFRDIVLEDVE